MYAYDLLSFDSARGRKIRAMKRLATADDIDAMIEIEKNSFDVPWSRFEFEFSLNSDSVEMIVVEIEGVVQGYAAFEKRNGSLRLLNCAVAENARRQGLGTALVDEMRSRLVGKRQEIVCVVSESNVVAQLFLRSMGFRAHWIARNFYSNAKEDAYRMTYKLEDRALFELEAETRRAG